METITMLMDITNTKTGNSVRVIEYSDYPQLTYKLQLKGPDNDWGTFHEVTHNKYNKKGDVSMRGKYAKARLLRKAMKISTFIDKWEISKIV